MLTVELILRGAKYFPERTAVLFEDRSLTFAEVDEIASRFANVLASNGIQRGSRLAILANKSLYSMPVDFACVKAGAAHTPLNYVLVLIHREPSIHHQARQILEFADRLTERTLLQPASRRRNGQTPGPASSRPRLEPSGSRRGTRLRRLDVANPTFSPPWP